MKNWQDICEKYDSEIMEEFYLFFTMEYGQTNRKFADYNIKDVWGWIICFAETKGYFLILDVESVELWEQQDNRMWKKIAYNYDLKSVKEYMLWCADKFFEIAK